MKKINFKQRKASIFLIVLFSIMMLTPTFSASIHKNNMLYKETIMENDSTDFFDPVAPFPAIPYDTNYIPIEDVKLDDEQNDIGYNTDVGDDLRRASSIYIGEPIEETTPGRGRTGSLDPLARDEDDYYRFSVCTGQAISIALSSSQPYGVEILDKNGEIHQNGAQATETAFYYAHVFADGDDPAGDYTLSIQLNGQNDAGTGSDAGGSIGAATKITPGSYEGYMDYQDVEDWYSFDVTSGNGIRISIEPQEKSDFDLHLYDPSGNHVLSAMYYEDDVLEYPADSSGTWKVKIDMFPGWDTSKWPDDYFLYGSGAYELELEVGVEVEAPIDPLPQPEIIPVAQTFIINDDPDSNKDEYAYLAAVPAANYFQDGDRYLSPIIYQGVDDIPTWFTTVDQTTQYLIDDWTTYLDRHGMTADEIIVNSDPIQAAAEIATQKWTSANTVVVTVDGSNFEDELETVVDADKSLSSTPSIERVTADDFIDVSGSSAKPMYIGNQWGAIHLRGVGNDFAGDTGLITPRYEGVMEDWWPYPYDEDGEDYDSFYPVTKAGLWFPYVTDTDGLDELQVIKYEGDRYSVPISNSDASIEVTLTTDSPSNLIAYIIDPEGNVRRPMTPHYNGGEIKQIHYWNGGHWQHDQDEFRRWIIEPHTEFTVDVHNAMEGTWTVIVVPFMDENGQDVGYTGNYHVTINKRNYNEQRVNAAMSASNAAVIASMNHAPLLYVTESEVPSATGNAINQLGANTIIFVNIGDVSSANPSATKELTSTQAVIDEIKSHAQSENFITIISLGTGDGYFAPAAMAAAYHTAPILNIGEAPVAYNTIDMIATWREYAGDYYHGCRSVGHLPQLIEPITLKNPPSWISLIFYYLQHDEFPHVGLDLKLTWFGSVAQSMQEMIRGYDLDLPGKEAFLFVSPRDTDIRDVACRALVGNESFAGHIPVETAAFSSDVICRDILYPALIYANPGRDVITSQMANYPDGYTWQANDGNGYPNYATRQNKETFFSRDRFFEGHIIIENLIERYNKGTALSYYTGHGTGGSGISGQFKNVNEDFPLAELRHEHLEDFDWWDAWRGYSGYDNRQTKLCREGGDSGYNSQEPALYDFVHFKWADQLIENLHSELEIWSSCTTGEHWGPIMYLSHGSALWYGCAGSAYGVQDDLHNSWLFMDVLMNGDSFGASQSRYTWLFNRDFTTLDPTTLYGRSSLFQISQGGLTNVKVLYADPMMTCYAPDWIEPTPVEA
jgi:pre-peptidase